MLKMFSQINIIFLSVIIALPILCQISREIFPSNSSNKFRNFDSCSYYSSSNNISLKDNHTQNMLPIQDYQHSRVFIKTKYNKIKLLINLSQGSLYEDQKIEFIIDLDINNTSNATINNYSFIYSGKLVNENVLITLIQESLFDKDETHLLKNVSIEINNSFQDFEALLIFDTFDLNLNLKKEKLTFRFFYLVRVFLNCALYFIILAFFLNEKGYNLQNISITFLIIIRSKIVVLFVHDLVYIFKVGPPIHKYLFFYCHLLIYGEFLINLTDIIILILFFIIYCFILGLLILRFENDENYIYSFRNKMINGVITEADDLKVKYYLFEITSDIIAIFILLCDISNKSIIPLYIGLIIVILKHLSQREVINIKYKWFVIKFYSLGILFFILSIFFNNIIKKSNKMDDIFEKGKIIASILVLYIILIMVIKNEIKFSFVMKNDFNKLNILNDEYCSICLNKFKNTHNGRNIFCMISELDNIHITKCKHYFHEICLFDWRKRKNICPYCRTTLEIPKYYYFYSYTSIKFNFNYNYNLGELFF